MAFFFVLVNERGVLEGIHYLGRDETCAMTYSPFGKQTSYVSYSL